jgi:hypothetical protein
MDMPYANELILMIHPALGVLAILATLWVLVEVINVGESNVARIRYLSLTSAILVWLTYIVGGYWYVTQYAADKAIILAGPWPVAHSVGMEAKEHVFLMLLLLATLLPIVAYSSLLTQRGVQRMMIWISALIVVTGLSMEGAGAFISMGAKVALLAKQLS